MDISRRVQQQQPHAHGLAGEFRQLQADGQASAAELREFLGHLKGRSPEEVMGVVDHSSLVKSTFLATLGCVVLLAVATAIPYLLKDHSPKPEEQAAAASSDESVADNTEATANATDTAAAANAESSSGEPDLGRAVEAMGIGGTAEAPPDKNPLDSKLDKLLDGIE